MEIERTFMRKHGINAYKDKFSKTPDSVLVASYMKSEIECIKSGLIPKIVRDFLISTLSQHCKATSDNKTNETEEEGICNLILDHLSIPEEKYGSVFCLLSSDSRRLSILRSVGRVAKLVLDEGKIDKIDSLMLARIIKVSGKDGYADITINNTGSITVQEIRNINEKLDEWNAVWGLILENSEKFLYNDAYEKSLLGMYAKVSQIN